MNVAKSDAGNAPVPSRMDHPLLHEAERAKGVAHTPMSETRAARQWTVFISHELDGVELGSPPPDVHVPNSLPRDPTKFRQRGHGLFGNRVVEQIRGKDLAVMSFQSLEKIYKLDQVRCRDSH
ncbi:MAG: hypothetical protein QOH35_251 [Acidobacteriaceae bacterium]|nr:hypothetical protein [Acidobacteriaceae bacterium]